MAISNDKEFKTALAGLSTAQQRQVAASFVQRVFTLSGDIRIKAALDAAARADVSDAELTVLSGAANTARVESFTQCGKETDWSAQAGHFVAKAAVACVKAAEAGSNLAWDAAMHARMARTCQTVADGAGTENVEAGEQYRLLEAFLNS
jgi:predicted negative regulator of RcsB-dependent stress response